MRNQKKAGVISALKAVVRSHRILTISTLLCVAASVAASLIPPLLLKNIIDRLTGGMPLLFTAVLLYFCSLVLEGTLSSAQETLLVLFGQKMTHALRSEMSQKLIALPASTLVGQNPGEVAARFSGDVDAVEALFTSGIISMVADACRIISILAVIAVENMGLALVLLVILPLFAVFTRFVQKRMLAAQLENRRAVAAVSGQVPETLHNIRTIHALGLESYMEQRYDQRIGESYAAMEKTNFYDAIYSPVVFLLNAAVVGIVMLLSASGNADVLALFGMSVGTSVAIINYISRIFSPIESLGMEIQTIQSAMAGVKRIDAFLNQPERAISQERKNTARGDVVLSHVTFGYGEKPVLSDFSMSVKEGEQVTLVGRTGAGKSTVFRLLLGLYQPEKGDITIGGVNVSAIPDHERRACTGCVEQHFSRVPGTVLDQITLSDPTITEEMARMPRNWREWMTPSARFRTGTIPSAQTACFRRGSGNCCPLRARQRQTRRCCCWTKSPRTSMPKPKRAYWKRSAAPPRDAPCCPFRTAFMKIWAAEPWNSSRTTPTPLTLRLIAA